MLSRRTFSLTCTGAALPASAATAKALILVTGDQARRIKTLLGAPGDVVRELAEAALKSGPWSVTTTRPKDTNAGPNDYYSEGPYWWPDPKNPGGPYIRKDGERYPGRFTANRNDLGSVCGATLALGMGAYLLGDKRYSDHASRILSTWFLDPKTRMNPNLEYGQAVRGHNTGRGIGIIDTVSFIHCAQGIMLLELAGLYDAAPVRRWLADYLKWMTTSQKGLDEKKAENNHGTWWTAQAAAFSTLTGDAANLQMAWKQYRDVLVPNQIEADGSCPREEARTNSLSYSAMNLDAFAVICRIAQTHGVDLWQYKGPKGAGVQTAFRYLLPYVRRPETWKKPQISKWTAEGTIFPALAGLDRGLPLAKTPWVEWVGLAATA
jgi:hypothetical protein